MICHPFKMVSYAMIDTTITANKTNKFTTLPYPVGKRFVGFFSAKALPKKTIPWLSESAMEWIIVANMAPLPLIKAAIPLIIAIATFPNADKPDERFPRFNNLIIRIFSFPSYYFRNYPISCVFIHVWKIRKRKIHG